VIPIAMTENAAITEKNPDCCTALRGRKNLDVQTNIMVADPYGCD
jgi:hypothetical protein